MNIKYFLLLILVLLLNPITSVAQIFNQNLTIHFPFDNVSIDESENNYEPTVYGTTFSNDRFENENLSISFNGEDEYLLIENEDQFECLDDKISFSIWVKLNELPSMSENVILISNRTDFLWGATSWIGIKNNNGGIGFDYYHINGGQIIYDSLFITSDLNWHHLVGIFDQEIHEMRFYIDNELVGTREISNFTLSGLKYINIGGSLLSNQFLNANIDDVRIYNRIITDCEIDNLFSEHLEITRCEQPNFIDCEEIVSNISLLDQDKTRIYPNPASQELFVEIDQNDRDRNWILLNNFGQTLDQGEFSSERIRIDIRNVDNGIYYLKIGENISKIIITNH